MARRRPAGAIRSASGGRKRNRAGGSGVQTLVDLLMGRLGAVLRLFWHGEYCAEFVLPCAGGLDNQHCCVGHLRSGGLSSSSFLGGWVRTQPDDALQASRAWR